MECLSLLAPEGAFLVSRAAFPYQASVPAGTFHRLSSPFIVSSSHRLIASSPPREQPPNPVLPVQLRHQDDAEGDGYSDLQGSDARVQGGAKLLGDNVVGGPEDARARHQREDAADQIDRDRTLAHDGQHHGCEGDQHGGEKDHVGDRQLRIVH